jgi:hypothetical protein
LQRSWCGGRKLVSAGRGELEQGSERRELERLAGDLLAEQRARGRNGGGLVRLVGGTAVCGEVLDRACWASGRKGQE